MLALFRKGVKFTGIIFIVSLYVTMAVFLFLAGPAGGGISYLNETLWKYYWVAHIFMAMLFVGFSIAGVMHFEEYKRKKAEEDERKREELAERMRVERAVRYEKQLEEARKARHG